MNKKRGRKNREDQECNVLRERLNRPGWIQLQSLPTFLDMPRQVLEELLYGIAETKFHDDTLKTNNHYVSSNKTKTKHDKKECNHNLVNVTFIMNDIDGWLPLFIPH